MFNQKEINFYSIIPEVADIAPIIPARELKPKWFKKSQDDFAKISKRKDFGKHKFTHTAKCPGIFNLLRYGWIMTAWQDIVIKTNGDGKSFEWRTPMSQVNILNGELVGEEVDYHSEHHYYNFAKDDWDNSMKIILKINTPWRCIVPKGYYLLEGPVPYTDETKFTTLPGFFSDEYGTAQMNVQLKWHMLNDEVLIKAGTPIAHYMLVPKDEMKMKVTKATDKQIYKESVLVFEKNKRFVTDKGKSKCIFARMFKK